MFNTKVVKARVVVSRINKFGVYARLNVAKLVHVYGNLEEAISEAPLKTSISDDDILAILDSEDGLILKRIKASRLADGGLF